VRRTAFPAALRTRLDIWIWRNGWAWPLALLITASAAGAVTFLLEPARMELVRTESQLLRTQRPPAPEMRVAAVANNPETRLLAVQSMLPMHTSTAAVVRQLAELAHAERIDVARAEYFQTPHATTQIQQLQVIQPVRAGYPQVKSYIEAVLIAIPSASLDQVTVRRDNVGQAQLEVRLRWSFWSRLPERTAAVPAGEARP
jgi:hypothetical protein